ncbi:MAG: serine/threonine-protein kinase [Thermoguttaceae bacterium]
MSSDAPQSAVPAPDGDLSGRQLGDFHLLRRLGRGAMAEVYLAEQERLKRRVAVKILKLELAGDRVYLQRFELEAQAAASLVHANIVQIYEVGCVDQLHYIAQEYVQGQNLRDFVTRHGPPDLPHALSIMRQVASALVKAAEQGVVHRDIKPENIMLTAGGEVKVADFGLARLTRPGGGNDLTQIGITLGTPLYMSPEQVEGRTLDPRSDIYSFGVTCYHMLTGSPPFEGETALGVAVQHLKKSAQPLESLRPDLPPSLCRIVHQMLAKDPSRRFASARDLLRELRRVQMEHFGDDWPDDLPAWDSIAAEMPPDPRIALTRQLDELMKAASRRRSWHWRAAGVAVGLVAALAVGAVAGWWLLAPASLLAEARAAAAAPVIPKQENVWRQCYRASQLNTEAAWQSVIDYFPDKEYATLRARQQLALIYLRKGEWDRAMAIFEKLASPNLDAANPKFEVELKAFGLAGQCGVLSIRGEFEESNSILGKLSELAPIDDKLTSEPLRKLLRFAINRNRAKLGENSGREWNKWLEQFHDEG